MVNFRRWSVWKLETVWAAAAAAVVVAVAVLLELGTVQAQQQYAAPYYHTPVASPPPAHEEATPHHHPLIPAPHTTLHGGSGHRLLKAVVIGRVLCRKCQERRPLPGAQVAVVCWAEDSEASFYGVTNADGLYRIELVGFDYEKYGGNACRAKLVAVQPDSPCRMAASITAMRPAPLHVKSKAEEEVVLYSKPFILLAATSVEECMPRPSTHAYYYPSPPHHGLSPVSHEYQNHPPPPLILHQSPPPHPYACTVPPPPESESWPHSPPHLPSHIPPPLYHYYTPQQPPLYLPPHHENSLPPPPYHKPVTPLPPPHATDHFYSPPTSYYKPLYPPPYAHPDIHPPPLYHNSPSTVTPPYKYESPPPPVYYDHPTLPPPASPHIEVPYPPAGNHETPVVAGQTPPSIPHEYESPPPPEMLPPYEYHPPPVDYNAHQSTQGTPLSNSQIPSFHKGTRVSPPAS